MKFVAAKILLAVAYLLALSSAVARPLVHKMCLWIYYASARKELKMLYLNLEKIMGLPRHASSADIFAKQCIAHQIHASLDGMEELLLGRDVYVENVAEFRAFLARVEQPEKPLIVVTAHAGCWELMAKHCTMAFKKPLKVLAKRARVDALDQLFVYLRAKAGVSVLHNDSKAILRDMLGVLRAKQALGFVMDQKPQNRNGVKCSFFGKNADFVSGPASLALKTNAVVIGVFLMRCGSGHYRIIYREISDGGFQGSEEDLTKSMVQTIENTVMLYPEQWTWNYKRWKYESV